MHRAMVPLLLLSLAAASGGVGAAGGGIRPPADIALASWNRYKLQELLEVHVPPLGGCVGAWCGGQRAW